MPSPTTVPDPTPTSIEPVTPSGTTQSTPTATTPTETPRPTPTSSPSPTPIPDPTECKLVESGAGDAGAVELDVELVVWDLEVPWGLAILPSGDMLVTERPGRLRVVIDGELVAEPVLEIGVSDPDPLFGIDRLGFEGGLLDVLLHPEFESNQQFYLFVNVANADGEDIGRVLRYVLADDLRSATLERVILDDIPTGLHHQGGRMRIGPDGMLFVTVGAYEPEEAQDPDTLAGKLLRLGLDGQIPADNPDPTSLVYVSGIRNSQGFDWLDDGRIVMVDHGPSGLELNQPDLVGFDEVNIVSPGGNFGRSLCPRPEPRCTAATPFLSGRTACCLRWLAVRMPNTCTGLSSTPMTRAVWLTTRCISLGNTAVFAQLSKDPMATCMS